MTKPAIARTRLTDYPSAAWVIFAGMFLTKFGNFLNVFLVLYLISKGYTAFQAGLALSVTGLGAFVGNMVGGTVADRFGRRAAIVISKFGCGAATLAVPFVDGLWQMTALVGVVGVFAQLYRPGAGALLIDVVPEKQRVGAFAVLRLAINLGMAVGPMVGGLLSAHSYTIIFVFDAVCSFLFAGLALAKLPVGRPPQVESTPPEAAPTSGGKTRDGYRRVFSDRPYLLFLVSMIAATFVYIQSNATLPMHVADQGLSNSFFGLLLGLNAVVCIVAELPLTRWTEKRDPRHVIAAGLVVLGLGIGMTGISQGEVLLVFSVLLWSFGEIIYTPIASAYPSQFSPATLRGRYQAAEGVAHTAGQALGPAIGGGLYAMSAPMHWTACLVVALVGALLVLPAKPRYRYGQDGDVGTTEGPTGPQGETASAAGEGRTESTHTAPGEPGPAGLEEVSRSQPPHASAEPEGSPSRALDGQPDQAS